IDEVHMISTSAFNALLKTLEEPPKHVVFILATTEPHKIPLTIMSRCQCFDFKPITNQAIVRRMQTIIEKEDINVSDEALEAVALVAEGGMRDALSILDQAISFSDANVSLDDVLAVTGGVSQQILTEMIQTVYNQDSQHALTLLDDLIKNGKDPGRFVFDLLYFLRDLLLYKSAPSLDGILERAILDADFKELSDIVDEKWIRNAIMQLNKCQQDMKWTNSPKMFIEIAILTLTNQQDYAAKEPGLIDNEMFTELTEKVDRLEKELTAIKQEQSAMGPPVRNEPKRKQPSKPKNGYKIPYEKIRTVLGEAKRESLQEVQKQWTTFLSALKGASAPAHATIQDSKPAAASDEALVVAFKYDIHCSLFLDNRETVESVFQRTMQKPLTIIPIPVEKWQELREAYIQGKEQSSATTEPETEDPLIKEARNLVGDDLLHIHD
ncbi:MAG TPA: DNA polymerase III subunit gamma/tau, partial [Bacillota bacterium]|nr:DNA polymerase III subunit gamma/tau [Bacillota bacterium]